MVSCLCQRAILLFCSIIEKAHQNQGNASNCQRNIEDIGYVINKSVNSGHGNIKDNACADQGVFVFHSGSSYL